MGGAFVAMRRNTNLGIPWRCFREAAFPVRYNVGIRFSDGRLEMDVTPRRIDPPSACFHLHREIGFNEYPELCRTIGRTEKIPPDVEDYDSYRWKTVILAEIAEDDIHAMIAVAQETGGIIGEREQHTWRDTQGWLDDATIAFQQFVKFAAAGGATALLIYARKIYKDIYRWLQKRESRRFQLSLPEYGISINIRGGISEHTLLKVLDSVEQIVRWSNVSQYTEKFDDKKIPVKEALSSKSTSGRQDSVQRSVRRETGLEATQGLLPEITKAISPPVRGKPNRYRKTEPVAKRSFRLCEGASH